MHQIICDDWNFSEDVILEILEALKGRKEIWTYLTETREDSGHTPGKRTLLASAIHNGRLQVAQKLLQFEPSLIELNDRKENESHYLFYHSTQLMKVQTEEVFGQPEIFQNE